jgi:hypothetical protein
MEAAGFHIVAMVVVAFFSALSRARVYLFQPAQWWRGKKIDQQMKNIF